MSLATLPLAAPRRRWRLSTLVVAAVATLVFVGVAYWVIEQGYLRRDIAALQDGEAWRTGGWLSQLVLRLVSLLPGVEIQQLVLSLTAAATMGLLFGAIHERLVRNGWLLAWALLAIVACHAQVLYAISAAGRGIPLYVAIAAMIPAIRASEEVGDVQSAIGLGLLMPLLVLAGPVTTPLIVPLAIFMALANDDARRDPRAFFAMLLVAVLPSLIVCIGILGFLTQAGLGIGDALRPYVVAYGRMGLGDVVGSVASLAVFAPVLAIPLLYCVWPSLGERRHVFSALAVVVLPLYLAVMRVVMDTQMQAFVPPVALLAAFVCWLAVVRLPIGLRIAAVAMLVASAAASWTLTGLWDDPAWKIALF